MLATIAKFLAGHAIAMFTLSVGLRTDRNVLVGLRGRWPALLRALVIVWFAVPVVAMIAIYVLRPGALPSATLMAMAICPGIPIALRKSKTQQGDAALSLLILIATSLTAVLVVPLWCVAISSFTPLALGLGPGHVAATLLQMVLVPLVVGYAIRRGLPHVAERLAKVAMVLFVAGLAILAIAVLVKSLPALRELTVRSVAAAFAVAFGSASIGYLVGGAQRSQRISLAYAAALGNPALAITALASDPRILTTGALPLVGAFVLIRTFALLPFNLVVKKKGRSYA